MGVRLEDHEAWAELASAHTGILTTLRRDGRPVSVPVWFAVVGRRIYVRTPAKTRKVEHVRHDRRATFLVERGEHWIELCAVMLHADVDVVEPGDEYETAAAAIDAKYAGFGMSSEAMRGKKAPSATRRHYGGGSAVLRLTPVGRMVTWDNARLRLPPAHEQAAP
jgi:nitroimidazol reductase NimA-like FMN-containing flavoprotein (pyridoxamine 5'-phosphate oxidase superfamily)